MKLLTSSLLGVIVFGVVCVNASGDLDKRSTYPDSKAKGHSSALNLPTYRREPVYQSNPGHSPQSAYRGPSNNGPGYGRNNGPGYGSNNGPGYARNNGQAAYGGSGHGRPRLNNVAGYGPGAGGYGGYWRKLYANIFAHPSGPEDAEEPLDEVDKLYARMEDSLSQLKAYSEMYESLAARLSQQKQELDQLTQLDFVAWEETDKRQTSALDILDSQLADITSDANAELGPALSILKALNMQNTHDLESAALLLDRERARDALQDGEIAALNEASVGLKNQLLQVKQNEFEIVEDITEAATSKLSSVKTKELLRKCENGQVTLDADDRKVEYQYQTTYDRVPQILYGLCGFSFNFDAKTKDSKGGYEDTYGRGHGSSYGNGHGYGGGYGNSGYSAAAPAAIGARVNAFSSRTGLTLELFDLSFGDATNVSADVCFQACSIGPGAGPVDH